MATETLKRTLTVVGATVGLLLWLGAMLLLGRATQGADQFAELYNWLFLVNTLGGYARLHPRYNFLPAASPRARIPPC